LHGDVGGRNQECVRELAGAARQSANKKCRKAKRRDKKLRILTEIGKRFSIENAGQGESAGISES